MPVQYVSAVGAAELPVGAIDQGWPYRQKEVVAEFNKVLGNEKTINRSHVLHVRRAHDVERNGGFCYTQKHVSPKYSRSFVDWMIQEYKADPDFFEKAKQLADAKRATTGMSATVTP
jgi:hypothetical protein